MALAQRNYTHSRNIVLPIRESNTRFRRFDSNRRKATYPKNRNNDGGWETCSWSVSGALADTVLHSFLRGSRIWQREHLRDRICFRASASAPAKNRPILWRFDESIQIVASLVTPCIWDTCFVFYSAWVMEGLFFDDVNAHSGLPHPECVPKARQSRSSAEGLM